MESVVFRVKTRPCTLNIYDFHDVGSICLPLLLLPCTPSIWNFRTLRSQQVSSLALARTTLPVALVEGVLTILDNDVTLSEETKTR